MLALKKWMDKTIWNIKISIWHYTVCGRFANGIENYWSRHEIKNDPTYFLVHITIPVVNN